MKEKTPLMHNIVRSKKKKGFKSNILEGAVSHNVLYYYKQLPIARYK